jgi:hypothetical protein
MMKFNRTLAAALVVAVWGGSLFTLRAEDWTTTDGKTYQDVKVIHADADAVTIIHHDGGGRVPLANLPPAIQKRFNYDPAKAQAAARDRLKSDAANSLALQAEMNQAAKQRQPGTEPSNPDSPGATASETSDNVTEEEALATVDSASGTDSSNSPTDSAPSLPPNVTDSNHHTIGDLSDPNYYTTSHLVYTIRTQGLGPDKSDPTHHSMDEIH